MQQIFKFQHKNVGYVAVLSANAVLPLSISPEVNISQ